MSAHLTICYKWLFIHVAPSGIFVPTQQQVSEMPIIKMQTGGFHIFGGIMISAGTNVIDASVARSSAPDETNNGFSHWDAFWKSVGESANNVSENGLVAEYRRGGALEVVGEVADALTPDSVDVVHNANISRVMDDVSGMMIAGPAHIVKNIADYIGDTGEYAEQSPAPAVAAGVWHLTGGAVATFVGHVGSEFGEGAGQIAFGKNGYDRAEGVARIGGGMLLTSGAALLGRGAGVRLGKTFKSSGARTAGKAPSTEITEPRATAPDVKSPRAGETGTTPTDAIHGEAAGSTIPADAEVFIHEFTVEGEGTFGGPGGRLPNVEHPVSPAPPVEAARTPATSAKPPVEVPEAVQVDIIRYGFKKLKDSQLATLASKRTRARTIGNGPVDPFDTALLARLDQRIARLRANLDEYPNRAPAKTAQLEGNIARLEKARGNLNNFTDAQKTMHDDQMSIRADLAREAAERRAENVGRGNGTATRSADTLARDYAQVKRGGADAAAALSDAQLIDLAMQRGGVVRLPERPFHESADITLINELEKRIGERKGAGKDVGVLESAHKRLKGSARLPDEVSADSGVSMFPQLDASKLFTERNIAEARSYMAQNPIPAEASGHVAALRGLAGELLDTGLSKYRGVAAEALATADALQTAIYESARLGTFAP